MNLQDPTVSSPWLTEVENKRLYCPVTKASSRLLVVLVAQLANPHGEGAEAAPGDVADSRDARGAGEVGTRAVPSGVQVMAGVQEDAFGRCASRA